MNGFEDLKFDWKNIAQNISERELLKIKNVFYNTYNKIPPLLKNYVYRHQQLPIKELQILIEDFRHSYPTKKRNMELEGFYFDNRLGSLIKEYKKILSNPISMEILNLEFELEKNIESFRIEKIATQEDENRLPILKKGTKYTQFKEIKPKDEFDYFEDFNYYEKAFVRFIKTDCLSHFILQLKIFVKNYDTGTTNAFEIELKKINDFINEANKIDLIKAKKQFNPSPRETELIEYSKLKNNHYKQKTDCQYYDFFKSPAQYVYGRYFLYKDWLEKKLILIEQEEAQKKQINKTVYLNQNIKKMNNLDYLEIILQGYCNENNREHLDSYFLREQKKAEKQYYNQEEFFSGCLKQVNTFENILYGYVNKRESELHKMLNAAKSGKGKYADNKNNKPIEIRHKETIEYCKKELSEINESNFTINLFSLTNAKYKGDLNWNEVQYIKEQLNKANPKIKGTINKIDQKLFVLSFDDEKIYSDNHYKQLKSQIENNGFLSVKTDEGLVKIFTLELYFILTSKELEVDICSRHNKPERAMVDGWKYFDSYHKGYDKGKASFNKMYSTSTDTLYGTNSKSYIDEIHQKYFHETTNDFNRGWQFVKKSFPKFLTHKIAENFGFYSGMINEVDELAKRYSILFEDFYKCKNANEAETITENIISNLPIINNQIESNELSIEILKDNWLPEAKISVEDFLEKGFNKGIWDKNFELVVGRGSMYGSGKTLLASLSIALKGYSISSKTDHKVIGKAFCKAFHIKVKEGTSNQYKSFQVGNAKYIREFKREFNIK